MTIWVEVVSLGRSMVMFFSSGRRHTRFDCDWSSDVCSSDLLRTSRIARAERPLSSVYRFLLPGCFNACARKRAPLPVPIGLSEGHPSSSPWGRFSPTRVDCTPLPCSSLAMAEAAALAEACPRYPRSQSPLFAAEAESWRQQEGQTSRPPSFL